MSHKIFLSLVFAGVCINTGFANSVLWSDVSQDRSEKTTSVSADKVYQLNNDALHSLVGWDGSQPTETFTLNLPLPDVGLAEFEARFKSQLGEGESRFLSWNIQAVDRNITGNLNFSSIGLRGTLLMPDGDLIAIEPTDVIASNGQYRTAFKSSSHDHSGMQCLTKAASQSQTFKSDAISVQQRAARGLKVYRLAVASTPAYTNFFGGQVNALNAIRATVDRINTLYVRDLEIRLDLVSGTNVVFTNANSPYSSSDPSILLDENTNVLNTEVGVGNYDIGHVVGQGGTGGIAGSPVVCNAFAKGAGVTSRQNPTGPAFDIDFVAHEIGHQLGATHTFNSQTGSCAGGNRVAQTAFEPGSGSTVMAYAGICAPNNLQQNSDAIFHIASIEQIDAVVRSGSGAVCGSNQITINNAPDIDTSQLTQNLVVNANQPFTLTGAATDLDGDTLSYNWDQLDAGQATDLYYDAGNNALFRSTLSSTSPSRTFDGLTTKNRNLTFRFVVRDGRGGVSSAPVMVTVVNGEALGTPASISPNAPTGSSDSGGGGFFSYHLMMILGSLLLLLVVRKKRI